MSPRTRLELRPTVSLVAYARLLSADAAELERMLERELRENPALERMDAIPGVAVAGAASEPADEPGTLARLVLDARLSLPACDHAVLELIAGSLDHHGLLTVEPAAIARAAHVPLARAERVLAVVRELGPAGIATRDLRECLDAQLQRLTGDAGLIALARRIVAGALDELAAGRYGAIARELGVERAQVVAARDLIRRRLRPFPVLEAPMHGPREPLAAPEVFIALVQREPLRLRVELTEERHFSLRVSPSYAAVADAAAGVRRARAFLRRLDERWSTIRRVAEAIAYDQHRFLLEGPGALHELTRAQIAGRLGLHESTVSRAVAGRSAQLPSGRVVALSAFFTASLSVQDALREIVACETRPLSDGELALALARRGHRVARRTVAKYRALLDIPPSSRRTPEASFAPGRIQANAASPAGAPAR